MLRFTNQTAVVPSRLHIFAMKYLWFYETHTAPLDRTQFSMSTELFNMFTYVYDWFHTRHGQGPNMIPSKGFGKFQGSAP